MNELELASELRDVYKSGLKNGTATAEAVLFGIRRASDIHGLAHFASSRTSVIMKIITLSGVNRNVEPMISLGYNLSSSVKIIE